MVSFPTDQVIATAGIPFEYPCTATGTAVTVNIVLLNGDQEDFTQVVSEGRSTLSFNSSTSGNFTFSCTGVNTVGSDSASLIIEVRSLSENIDAINNIIPGEIISPEMAVQLLSVSFLILFYVTSLSGQFTLPDFLSIWMEKQEQFISYQLLT